MTTSLPSPTVSPVERGIVEIRGLFGQRQYDRALLSAEALAREVPENRDVLYLMAMSQRFMNNISAALATLECLERLHPRYSRLYQERGHCYVALKDARQAIQAFLVGVNVNPTLRQSWTMLVGLYRMTGETDNAAMAAGHVATLKRLPPEVVTATSLFSDGDLAPAETMVRDFLMKQGDHVEAMRLLARIGIEREVLDDAEFLLEAVLDLAPDYWAARYDYARTLLLRHKHLRAREEIEKLLAQEPQNRQYRTLHATICVGLGFHEMSVGLYRDLLLETPDAPELNLSLAHSLKTLGRQREAIDAYHAVARARPNFGDAYWSLANLKTYRFSQDAIARMRIEEAAPTTTLVDRYHLCFALGKALEDLGDYAQSYVFYERGNSLKRGESRYRPDYIERNTALQIETCTRRFFAERSGMGIQSREPIFILGLPRAGSTLLEQILASHSRVEGTQELADIPRIVQGLQGRDPDLDNPRYPGSLRDLTAEDVMLLAEGYLRDTRIYRTDKPHFIDKMPNNFRHIGLIHLLLPNAKIIDARREPMACCFSNFKQLFAAGQEFTYSVSDIARYYSTYLDIMRHWDEVLPGRVLRVEYEAVVDDLAGSVRRLLDFCELEFEPGCVQFHKTQRSVRTASSEQVRQPIFRDGMDQWRRFETWLGPLEQALGDARQRYRC